MRFVCLLFERILFTWFMSSYILETMDIQRLVIINCNLDIHYLYTHSTIYRVGQSKCIYWIVLDSFIVLERPSVLRTASVVNLHHH